MPNKIYPPIPDTPKVYWDDSKWANENFTEISKNHPNLWVAIVDKQVVASGKVISDVRRIAQQKTDRKHFPVLFAEKGIHDSVDLIDFFMFIHTHSTFKLGSRSKISIKSTESFMSIKINLEF